MKSHKVVDVKSIATCYVILTSEFREPIESNEMGEGGQRTKGSGNKREGEQPREGDAAQTLADITSVTSATSATALATGHAAATPAPASGTLLDILAR